MALGIFGWIGRSSPARELSPVILSPACRSLPAASRAGPLGGTKNLSAITGTNLLERFFASAEDRRSLRMTNHPQLLLLELSARPMKVERAP
jgi:hypothetical protein